MCGINGIFAYHYAAGPIDERELLATRERMAREDRTAPASGCPTTPASVSVIAGSR